MGLNMTRTTHSLILLVLCSLITSYVAAEEMETCFEYHDYTVMAAPELCGKALDVIVPIKPKNKFAELIDLLKQFLPLLGVIVGYWVSFLIHRRQISADKAGRLIEDRVRIYSEFLDAVLDTNVSWHISKEADKHWEVAQTLRQSISLIASDEVEASTKNLYKILYDADYLRFEQNDHKVKYQHIRENIDAFDTAVTEYRNACRSELSS